MMELSEGLWPAVMGAGLKFSALAARPANLPFPQQTIVSNIPGPQLPLYLAGARLQLLIGLGPLTDGMGLFHAVVSGAGKISITFTGCRDMLPDPQFYRECLQDAWNELDAATRVKSAPSGAESLGMAT